MKSIAIVLVATNYISFLWSVFGVFKKVPDQDLKRYRALQMSSLGMWIFGLYSLCTSQLKDWEYIVICLIHILSLIGFWHTAKVIKENKFSIVFSKDTPGHLNKKGLYKKIRHPFYSIYLASYFTVVAFLPSIILCVIFSALFFLYIVAARLEEKKFLNCDLSTEYIQYRNEAGFFLPKL